MDKCDHEENRRKVCAPCGKKIVFGKSKPQSFIITEKLQTLVKKYVNDNFDSKDLKFPLAICGSCRLALIDREKNILKRPLQSMPNYEEIMLPKETRGNNDSCCNCYICLTGRFKGHAKSVKGSGHVRNLDTKINNCNGLFGASEMSQLPKKNMAIPYKPSSVNVCRQCLEEIGKGINHSCNARSNSAFNNIQQMVLGLPEKQQEQVVTTILKRKIDTSSDVHSARQKNIELKLATTTGPQCKIVMNPKKKKDVSFSTENLDNFKVNTHASSNHMKKFTNFLRSNAGKQSVPAYYNTKHVPENSKKLEHIYKDSIHDFDVEKQSIKEKRPVVWADAEDLLTAVLKERNQTNKPFIKVMADGGQGFFKICMTILPENYSPELDCGLDDSEMDSSELSSPIKKRSRYSEGGSSGKKGKLTGVHRLIMLCVVPAIKETYNNIKLLFDLTNINNIPFRFVADFKIVLIVNRQQTATSMYPSPYCFVTLNDLRNNDEELGNVENLFTNTVNDESNCLDICKDECLKLKTYGDLRNDFQTFVSFGKKKKYAMQCHSTINLPLFNEDDAAYVIEKCVIPELHILQGFVNHLFWDGLVPLLGREKALLWPKKLKLVPKNYQGEIFEGNACRKLLQESDKLNDPEIYADNDPLTLVPFISVFKAMNKVVHDCFSSAEISTELDKHISELNNMFESTGVSETLKIHTVLKHLKHGLHFLGNRGFGIWSEQAGESVHREFLKYWECYKINLITDPSYSIRLKKAVVEFSSLHV